MFEGNDVAVRYSPDQRMFAKTLMIATGSTDATLEILRSVWGPESDPDDFTTPNEVPSSRSLTMWKSDPRIPVDQDLLKEWGDRARSSILGASERLADRLEGTLNLAIDRYQSSEGSSVDILNVTKSYGIVADKLNGRFGNAPAVVGDGNRVFTGPVQIVAYGPKSPPQPSPVLEVESHPVEEPQEETAAEVVAEKPFPRHPILDMLVIDA